MGGGERDVSDEIEPVTTGHITDAVVLPYPQGRPTVFMVSRSLRRLGEVYPEVAGRLEVNVDG